MRLKFLLALTMLSACGGNSTGDEVVEAHPDAVDGEAAYLEYCAVCHENGISMDGIASAPIVGDAASWGDRWDLPLEVLTERAREGHGGMPPRASRPDLPDETVNAAVEHMLNVTFPDRPQCQ